MRSSFKVVSLSLIFCLVFNIFPLSWIPGAIHNAKADSVLTWKDFKKYEGKIAANDLFTYVLKDDGHVVSIGNNSNGEVESWSDVASISAGIEHVVGLKKDGTVVATGSNNYGETEVSSWTDMIAVSAGDHFTAGLKKDGTVVVTGDTSHGQTAVSDWTNIVAISAGGAHVVGLKADGTVVAAGDNTFGQLNVDYWQDIVSISAGAQHTVGLKSDGTVVSAGSDSNGQSEVYGMQNIVSVSAGAHYTMGLKSDGTVVLAGLFSTDAPNAAVKEWKNVVAISVGEYTMVSITSDGILQKETAYYYQQLKRESAWNEITSISTGWYQNLGLKSNGTVVSSGSNEQGESNVYDWNDMVQVAGGKFFTVGVKSDGTVKTAGQDSFGKQIVEGWNNIVSVAAGENHVVGLKTDGTVVGTANYDGSWNNIVQIAAAGSYTLALKRDGTVVGAGYNNKGQLNVSGWSDIVAIAAGLDFSLGLKSDGTVVAVGNNQYGQINVSDWHDIVAISAGYNQAVGLKRDGTVVATGFSQYGQTNVSSWTDIVGISAGISRTLGLKRDGTVITTDAGYFPSAIIKPQYSINKRIVKPNDDIKIKLSQGSLYNVASPLLSLNGGVNLDNQEMTQGDNGDYEFNYHVQTTDHGPVNISFPGTSDIFGKNLSENSFFKVIPLQSIKASKTTTSSGDKITIVASFYESVKSGFTMSLSGSQYLSGAQMTEAAGSNGTKYIYSYTVPYNKYEGSVDVALNNVETTAGESFLTYKEPNVFTKQNRFAPVTSLTTSKSSAKIGDVVTITANFSESMKNGVKLSFDGAGEMNPAVMTEESGSNGQQYTFNYTVPEGFTGNLNAHITDAYDVNNSLCQEYTSNNLFSVDGIRPALSLGVSQPLAKKGDHVQLTATFTEPVQQDFTLSLNDGSSTQVVSMNEVEGSNSTIFTYDFVVKDGVLGPVQATISGVKDSSGNTAPALTAPSLFQADGVAPKVVSLESDQKDYVTGDYAHITATFDEPVQSGVKVKLSGGVNNEEFPMTEVAGSNGKTYELYYEIKDGQKGSVDASLSNIMDVAGNAATYSKADVFYISDPTNANMKSITVKDGTNEYPLSPSFSPDTDTYTVKIPPNVPTVSIIGVAEDSRAAVTGVGSKNLVQGENDFELKVTSTDGISKTYKVIINVVDDTKPVIIGAENTTIGVGTPFDPAAGVKANDNVDGDITSQMQIVGTVDTNKLGQYEVDYSVSDKSGNTALIKRLINVVDNTPPVKPTVNDLDENQTKIFGITEPLAKVVATVNGNEIGSTVPDGDGNYSMTIEKQQAYTEISVYAIDDSGNQSDPVVVVVKDVTAPAQPIVNSVGDSDEAVTGQAEPDSIVTVKANGAVISSGTAGTAGKFSVMIPKQKAGIELAITAVDKAGNISEPATIMVKDVTAPLPPKVYNVTDQSVGVSGKTEANAKVTIIIGSKTYTTISDMQGNYKIDTPKQMVGTVTSVTAKDAAGNVSLPTTVTVSDGTAPTISYVKDVTDQDTVVTGKTEALATVNVKIDNSIYSSKADLEGNFNVSIPQQKGGIIIFVTAKDAVGNESNPISVTVKDITPPSSLVVNKVTDQSTEITGQAEADSSISVTIGKKRFTGKSDSEGKFVISIGLQKAGTEISVSVKDLFGNEGPIINIIVQDVTPPKTPFVNPVTSTSTEVSGRTEAGATVTVVIGTDRYFGKADDKGFYKVTIPQQKAGTELIITVTDSAGNISLSKSVSVVANGTSTNSINNLGEIRSLGNQLSAIRRQE